MLPSANVKELNLRDYLVIIDKRKWIIIAILVILSIPQVFFSFIQDPIYRATAVLLIERQQPKVLSVEQVYGGESADKEYYETQYKILCSRTLVKRLFEEMNLYLDPGYSGAKDPISAFIPNIIIEPVRGSRLVNICFEGKDPQKVTNIVNALAEAYIKQDLETRTKASRDALTWLMEQIASVKKKLEESETALVKYMEVEKIVEFLDPDRKNKETDLMETLKKEQTRLDVEMSEVSRRYGPKHPQMLKIESELGSVKSKLAFETQGMIELNKKSTQYTILKREVDSNRQLYETLVKRAKETGVSEQLESSNIRIVDPAEVPELPVRPNKKNDLIRAIFVSLILGFAAAFFVEYLDNTIKDPDDINLYIGLPFLGYVPCGKKEAKTEQEIDLIVHQKPRSTISEAYRSIRTSILFAFADKPAKTIMVTASNPKEGKTTTAINLGATMASTKEKVLVVDTDMRCSRLHKSFGLAKEGGLSEFLVNAIDMDTAIKSTNIENMSIVTAGSTPPNPAELLNSGKMKVFLEEAKKRFDRIIIDTPPIITVTDAAILSNIVDGTILVARCGKTPIEIILRAKQKLKEAKANILGVLLNNVDYGKESYYYYYYYYNNEEKPNS